MGGRLGPWVAGRSKPPVSGSAQPGPDGFATRTKPTTRGCTWCLPLKLMPSQSMKPSPVHEAASRNVSCSKSAHARPRETPPGPGSSRTAIPLYAMFEPSSPASTVAIKLGP